MFCRHTRTLLNSQYAGGDFFPCTASSLVPPPERSLHFELFYYVGGSGILGDNLPRQIWNQRTKFTYNHWSFALSLCIQQVNWCEPLILGRCSFIAGNCSNVVRLVYSRCKIMQAIFTVYVLFSKNKFFWYYTNFINGNSLKTTNVLISLVNVLLFLSDLLRDGVRIQEVTSA